MYGGSQKASGWGPLCGKMEREARERGRWMVPMSGIGLGRVDGACGRHRAGSPWSRKQLAHGSEYTWPWV